jgi:hypothetical protein
MITFSGHSMGMVLNLRSPSYPAWTFKRPKSPKINKMSLKMGNIRIYFVKTTKIEVKLRWLGIGK